MRGIDLKILLARQFTSAFSSEKIINKINSFFLNAKLRLARVYKSCSFLLYTPIKIGASTAGFYQNPAAQAEDGVMFLPQAVGIAVMKIKPIRAILGVTLSIHIKFIVK
jgi:hypothetical protein